MLHRGSKVCAVKHNNITKCYSICTRSQLSILCPRWVFIVIVSKWMTSFRCPSISNQHQKLLSLSLCCSGLHLYLCRKLYEVWFLHVTFYKWRRQTCNHQVWDFFRTLYQKLLKLSNFQVSQAIQRMNKVSLLKNMIYSSYCIIFRAPSMSCISCIFCPVLQIPVFKKYPVLPLFFKFILHVFVYYMLHTHTTILQPSWILSETNQVSQHQKGKTRKVKPILIYWSKR